MVVGAWLGAVVGCAEEFWGGWDSSLQPTAAAIKTHENKVAINFIAYSLQIVRPECSGNPSSLLLESRKGYRQNGMNFWNQPCLGNEALRFPVFGAGEFPFSPS
jgi:hypothetical protein